MCFKNPFSESQNSEFFYVFSQLSLVSRFWRYLKKSLLRKNSISQMYTITNYQTPPALRFLCKPLLFLVAQTVNWKFVVSVAQKHSFRGLVITYDATARIFGGDPFSKLRSLLLWKCSTKERSESDCSKRDQLLYFPSKSNAQQRYHTMKKCAGSKTKPSIKCSRISRICLKGIHG